MLPFKKYVVLLYEDTDPPLAPRRHETDFKHILFIIGWPDVHRRGVRPRHHQRDRHFAQHGGQELLRGLYSKKIYRFMK